MNKIRNRLLQKGYFPEVLPPCFDSEDLVRGFKGIINEVEMRKFSKRSSNYIRYSGTKHDGNRRNYGTVNPVPYFSLCTFIENHWKFIESKILNSEFAVSALEIGDEGDDRAVLIPALSEVTSKLSKRIRFAPLIVKTDIAQFFPSIYTHAISWVAHGILKSKADTEKKSKTIYFNSLDWFTQQCQNGQTRGVVIGPDGFRIIAEFLASDIDRLLREKTKDTIVGAIRHIDDFYIGVRSEIAGSTVLSVLRDVLQDYELQINDAFYCPG